MSISPPIRPADAGVEPVRVVYIVGSGRSGSTVLDTVLGNHPDAVSVGELGGLLRAVYEQNEFCACGQRGRDCEFWSRVLQTWHDNGGNVRDYAALGQRYQRLNGRSLLRVIGSRHQRSADFQRYLRSMEALYAAIAAVSGKSVIVDSSKNPVRAAAVVQLAGVDARVIHLVRDCRAVAWSVKKAFVKDERAGVHYDLKPRPAWRTAAYWAVVNLLAERVRRMSRVPSTRIRYEDFVHDPHTALAEIGRVAGLDLTAVAQAVIDGEPLRVGHTIAGNRLRMAGSIRLKPDWEWTRKLPRADRETCGWITGPLLRRYGYEKHVSAPATESVVPQAQLPPHDKAA